MSGKEARLLRDRALRNRAWAVFHEQLDRVKADLSARGVGERAADTVAAEAREVAGIGLSLAHEYKGLVAGTLGALMVWMGRNRILSAIKDITGGSDAQEDEPASQDGEPDRE
jgi:hypothetical protein